MPQDYYATLGVERSSDSAEIKKAYRKLARDLHPDHNPDDPSAAERFKEVTEAYAVLSDDEQRQRYDTLGSRAFHQQVNPEDFMRGFDVSSIFQELGLGGGRGGPRGGFGGFSQGAPRPTRGRDVERELEIGFEEALRGSSRSVQVADAGSASQNVDVRIPAGIDTGKRLRVRGRGQAGSGGGPKGDLYLRIKVAGHPRVRRKGHHLEMDLLVPLSTLLLGGEASVDTLDGERSVDVPPLTRAGTKLRLKGLGVPIMGQGEERGDLRFVLKTDLPEELSPEQIELAEALREGGL